MPYKIVQTVEDGGTKLSIVPAQWESKGVLWWPPKNYKYPLKLIKDENSKPGAGWVTLKCVIKRKNIQSYEEANKELTEMEQQTDTDFQEQYVCNFRMPSTSRNDGPGVDDINFEAIAENLSNPPPVYYETSMANVESQPETIHVYSTEDLKTVLANQELILTKLNAVIENQKKIALKVASLSIQVDETNLQNQQPINVTLLKDSADDSESYSIKPIETGEDFERFEILLADKAQKKKMSKFLSILCSTSPGKGITCAYKLLDVLFTREFLCKCSWSGGSKGDRSKIPLKNFCNFRKFFFEMIRTWDKQFTDDDMVKFFKVILRNAMKRKAMQGLRASAKRTRKNKKDTGDGTNPEEKTGDDAKEHDVNYDNNRTEPGADDGDDMTGNDREELGEDDDTGDDKLDLC